MQYWLYSLIFIISSLGLALQTNVIGGLPGLSAYETGSEQPPLRTVLKDIWTPYTCKLTSTFI